MRRVFRLMRKNRLLTCDRPAGVRGPDTRHRTVMTEIPDRMWAIGATGCLAAECNATVLVIADHDAEVCLGAQVALRGSRFEAIECLRHDHGTQFISYPFPDELKTVVIASFPSFVRMPEGNRYVERFIRTLKEQLIQLRTFDTAAELHRALREFAQRFNNDWTIGRTGYRTPARHHRELLAEAA